MSYYLSEFVAKYLSYSILAIEYLTALIDESSGVVCFNQFLIAM